MRPLLALNALVLTLIAWQLPGQLQEQRLQDCLNASWTQTQEEGNVRHAMVTARYPGSNRSLAHLFVRGCRLQVGMAPLLDRDANQDLFFNQKWGVTDLDTRLRAALHIPKDNS